MKRGWTLLFHNTIPKGRKNMARKCPVCGNAQHTSIQQIHMILPQNIPLPSQYDIVTCTRCGFCYADTPATQAEYDTYYSSYNNYSGQENNKLFYKTFSPIRSFVEEKLPLSANILDIGFGKGELLLQMRELGYTRLTGIDPSQRSVDSLRGQGICAYCKSVYDAPGELENSFDLAFLTSVAEHLLEPKKAINQACLYLKNGGYLIVDIPDYAMCDKVDLPVPNQFNQEHINYFSENSFSAMLQGMSCQLLSATSIELKDEISQISEYSKMFMIQKENRKVSGNTAVLSRDTQTENAIRRYLLQQENRQSKAARIISELWHNQVPLIVWGTGAMTMSLLASTKLPECNIIAFTDGNRLKIGTEFEGTTIIAPKELGNYPDARILICAMRYAADIEKEIVEMGLQNPVVTLR